MNNIGKIFSLGLVALLAGKVGLCFADSSSSKVGVRASVIAVCHIDADFESASQGVANQVDWSCTNGVVPGLSVSQDNVSTVDDITQNRPSFLAPSGDQSYSTTSATAGSEIMNVTLEF